jgi:hypothetical protein
MPEISPGVCPACAAPTTENVDLDGLKARLLSMYSHRGDGIPTQYCNQDGPDAARAIDTLLAEIERLRAAPAEAELRAEVAALRAGLHEIDYIASNTIPRDGKEAAFAALAEIAGVTNRFRLPPAALGDTQ